MKLGIIFPGQGTQYVGMGKRLYDNYSVAKRVFEEANEILGFDLTKLCFEGPESELNRTDNAQLAIFVTSMAAFKVFRSEFKDVPVIAAGHSLGEFSALASADAISFSDALKLVRKRGQIMHECSNVGEGTMAAIKKMNKEIVEQECENISRELNKVVMVSNYNSSNQIVISGNKDAVRMVGENLIAKGAEVTELKVSAAFHSSLMSEAALNFKEELSKYNFNEPTWNVISNVTAKPHDFNNIKELLTEQIVKPVQWAEIMKYFNDEGIEYCVELGPKSVLRNLFRSDYLNINSFSFDKPKDIEEIEEILTSTYSKNKFQHTVLTKCLAIAVCTKNNNWDSEEYEEGVIKPYRKIQQLQNKIEQENLKPTKEEMIEAINMLKSVFKTKKTPISEQEERFKEVLEQTETKNLLSEYI